MASYTNVEQLEADAKATAAKHVANMIHRADQLEKVEQYKRGTMRKKASVEALLKTAMQSQLDGVKTGLNQLQNALNDIRDIKVNLSDIGTSLKDIPELMEQLQDVKEENLKHFQYAVAMENLKNIFNVPENVAKVESLINEGKLLQAHVWLSELENSRDDLLFELFKLPNKNERDTILLDNYFCDVNALSKSLAQQLWLIFKRTLATVRTEPTLIVSAIRIIEREEKFDQMAMQQQKQTGFLAPGRPKNWRQKAFLVMEETIQERLEGNQLEVRDENTMWLVRHLELIRLLILEDLQMVKSLCVQCFPPEYDISNKFVKMYHGCLSNHLVDIIACGLENEEFVTILMWLNSYEGPELLKHPEINIDIKEIGPLLDAATVASLQEKYVNNIEQNFQVWMKKTVESELQDWYRNLEPESDADGCYHTTLSIVVFQMIEQNLQLAKQIGPILVAKVLRVSMVQVTKLGKLYYETIVDFKKKYFLDRSKIAYFTRYMVAMVNNCSHFIELCHRLKNEFWKPGLQDNDAARQFESMVTTFQRLREQTMHFLIEEMLIDLSTHFQDLMTRKWLTSSGPMDTICVTFEDYHADYQHLRAKNYEDVLTLIQHKILMSYIVAVLSKRITFSNFDERKGGAEKIIREVDQLQQLIKNWAPHVSKVDSPSDILIRFAEVLKVKDREILPLILSGLIHKYPDMTQEHLSALLGLRDDLGWYEVKTLVGEIIPETKDSKGGPIPKSILSQIELPSLFGRSGNVA